MITAIVVTPVTVNPTAIRYSVSADKFGATNRIHLSLQRSEKREDGTWIDDPHVGSSKSILLPSSCNTAWAGIESILPAMLSKLGVTATYTGYRLQLKGSLSLTGVLDVTVMIQILTSTGWIAKQIPSLTAFLTDNQDIATAILTAWDVLDVAINAANQTEEWL